MPAGPRRHGQPQQPQQRQRPERGVPALPCREPSSKLQQRGRAQLAALKATHQCLPWNAHAACTYTGFAINRLIIPCSVRPTLSITSANVAMPSSAHCTGGGDVLAAARAAFMPQTATKPRAATLIQPGCCGQGRVTILKQRRSGDRQTLAASKTFAHSIGPHTVIRSAPSASAAGCRPEAPVPQTEKHPALLPLLPRRRRPCCPSCIWQRGALGTRPKACSKGQDVAIF